MLRLMAAKNPVQKLDSLKRQRSVPEPIAADTWTFKDPKGRDRKARIEVG
jgi:hypothetical protein